MDTTTQATVTASGGLVGFIAAMSEIQKLFVESPILGFIGLGLLGGFAGWSLLIELGKLDGKPVTSYITILLRRMLLGAIIGVAIGIWWIDSGAESKGLWMLLGGAIATAPVEFSQAGIKLVVEFLRSKIPPRKEDA